MLFTNGEEHDGKKEVIERNVKIVSVRPGSEDVVAVVSSADDVLEFYDIVVRDIVETSTDEDDADKRSETVRVGGKRGDELSCSYSRWVVDSKRNGRGGKKRRGVRKRVIKDDERVGIRDDG